MSSQSANTVQGPLEYSSEEERLKIFGFWVFLGAEVILFGTLFATYLVMFGRTGEGPEPTELFKLKDLLIETFLLLTSSFTGGIAVHEMRRGNKTGLLIWLGITILLGLGFVGEEAKEFVEYMGEGASMGTSAYWSGFFTLVGTHGCHVSLGILWISGIMIQLARRGLNAETARKVFIASLYWHFLDVVWIFIFTLVYMTGMVM
ncbi:MAG TPA: cytochrome aa3 quinol oxidase subunit III [Bacillales bacterium]